MTLPELLGRALGAGCAAFLLAPLAIYALYLLGSVFIPMVAMIRHEIRQARIRRREQDARSQWATERALARLVLTPHGAASATIRVPKAQTVSLWLTARTVRDRTPFHLEVTVRRGLDAFLHRSWRVKLHDEDVSVYAESSDGTIDPRPIPFPVVGFKVQDGSYISLITWWQAPDADATHLEVVIQPEEGTEMVSAELRVLEGIPTA